MLMRLLDMLCVHACCTLSLLLPLLAIQFCFVLAPWVILILNFAVPRCVLLCHVTKAVADAWDATILKAATARPQAFGQLGYTWGHGEVLSLRSLLDYILILMRLLRMCVS